MPMLRRLLLAAMLTAAVGGVRAEGLSASDGAAIRSVIDRQIEAFGRDDAPGAFAFASPGIQKMFGTPERFLDMVRRTYPAVYRPRSVEYGELSQENGRIVQHVELTGQDGQPQLALYEVERDGDAWRITGCTLVRSLRVGT
ncbi:MAG: DUF4864 domain-containing protein [Janthinobacterium lividum]